MSEGQIVPIVVVSLIFGIPVIAVVGHYSYYAWKAWLELNLKREMVARGYTTDEILTVLRATNSSDPRWPGENQASQPRDPAMH
jgi:hypothetical protein